MPNTMENLRLGLRDTFPEIVAKLSERKTSLRKNMGVERKREPADPLVLEPLLMKDKKTCVEQLEFELLREKRSSIKDFWICQKKGLSWRMKTEMNNHQHRIPDEILPEKITIIKDTTSLEEHSDHERSNSSASKTSLNSEKKMSSEKIASKDSSNEKKSSIKHFPTSEKSYKENPSTSKMLLTKNEIEESNLEKSGGKKTSATKDFWLKMESVGKENSLSSESPLVSDKKMSVTPLRSGNLLFEKRSSIKNFWLVSKDQKSLKDTKTLQRNGQNFSCHETKSAELQVGEENPLIPDLSEKTSSIMNEKILCEHDCIAEATKERKSFFKTFWSQRKHSEDRKTHFKNVLQETKTTVEENVNFTKTPGNVDLESIDEMLKDFSKKSVTEMKNNDETNDTKLRVEKLIIKGSVKIDKDTDKSSKGEFVAKGKRSFIKDIWRSKKRLDRSPSITSVQSLPNDTTQVINNDGIYIPLKVDMNTSSSGNFSGEMNFNDKESEVLKQDSLSVSIPNSANDLNPSQSVDKDDHSFILNSKSGKSGKSTEEKKINDKENKVLKQDSLSVSIPNSANDSNPSQSVDKDDYSLKLNSKSDKSGNFTEEKNIKPKDFPKETEILDNNSSNAAMRLPDDKVHVSPELNSESGETQNSKIRKGGIPEERLTREKRMSVHVVDQILCERRSSFMDFQNESSKSSSRKNLREEKPERSAKTKTLDETIQNSSSNNPKKYVSSEKLIVVNVSGKKRADEEDFDSDAELMSTNQEKNEEEEKENQLEKREMFSSHDENVSVKSENVENSLKEKRSFAKKLRNEKNDKNRIRPSTDSLVVARKKFLSRLFSANNEEENNISNDQSIENESSSTNPSKLSRDPVKNQHLFRQDQESVNSKGPQNIEVNKSLEDAGELSRCVSVEVNLKDEPSKGFKKLIILPSSLKKGSKTFDFKGQITDLDDGEILTREFERYFADDQGLGALTVVKLHDGQPDESAGGKLQIDGSRGAPDSKLAENRLKVLTLQATAFNGSVPEEFRTSRAGNLDGTSSGRLQTDRNDKDSQDFINSHPEVQNNDAESSLVVVPDKKYPDNVQRQKCDKDASIIETPETENTASCSAITETKRPARSKRTSVSFSGIPDSSSHEENENFAESIENNVIRKAEDKESDEVRALLQQMTKLGEVGGGTIYRSQSSIMVLAVPIVQETETRRQTSSGPIVRDSYFYYFLGPTLDMAMIDVVVTVANLIDKIMRRNR